MNKELSTETNAELSTEQQAAILDAKQVLESKQDVLVAIGQVQAFNNMRKYVTVTEILVYRKIKESKQYKGLIAQDSDGNSVTVTDLKDVCRYFFNSSYEQMNDDLKNLETFGQDFLESSKKMELGYRELRKLRQLPEKQRLAVINSEEVDLADKSAVKELIEDLVLQHNQEKKELKAELKDSQQSLQASRDNAASKQEQLDLMKEDEAKRRYSQQAWQRQTLDNINGLIEGRLSVVSGLNQITDIFQGLTEDQDNKDQKAIDNIARSLLTEIQHASVLLETLKSNAFGLLGGSYSADLSADELLEQLALNQDQLLEE